MGGGSGVVMIVFVGGGGFVCGRWRLSYIWTCSLRFGGFLHA